MPAPRDPGGADDEDDRDEAANRDGDDADADDADADADADDEPGDADDATAADDDPTPRTLMQRASGYDALVAAGRLAEARALCDEMIEYLRFDEESCMRAGDYGEATKAERQRDIWLGRARTLA